MGNCVVVKNESDYFEKLSTVLNSEACDLLMEGPKTTIGRKIKKKNSTNKISFTHDEKCKLAPWDKTIFSASTPQTSQT